MPKPAFELADIFRQHGPAYRASHPMASQPRRVMRAIEVCRTAALGGHVEQCGQCVHTRIAYNSCRNRHCPKCQNTERLRWLENRKAQLLSVEYFQVVFTIPEELRVLSQLFRRLFLPALQNAFHPGRLQFFGKLAPLADKSAFLAYLAPWRERDWVVYAKPPFGSPEQVLAYLGRYTHRVAISHQRLLNVKQSEVTFQSKDYRHRHKQKSRRMTLTADEFIRRFLIHTLPPGFQRIRHFGFLANRFRKEKLALCRQLLVIPGTGLLPGPAQCLSFGQTSQASPLPAAPCPQCRTGLMVRIGFVPAYCWPAKPPPNRSCCKGPHISRSSRTLP
jgi:hypothetical protein